MKYDNGQEPLQYLLFGQNIFYHVRMKICKLEAYYS